MISDEKLIQALSDYDEKKLAQLSGDAVSEHTFSQEFEDKIRSIHRPRRTVSRGLRHMAACLAAVCVASAALGFFVSPTARAAMLSWVRGKENTYFTYRSTGSDRENTDLIYRLDTVPEGYTLFADHSDPGHGMAVYTNEDGQLLSFQYTADTGGSAMYLDPESAKHSTAVIGEAAADLYLAQSPSESSTIVWIDKETDYLLTVMGFFGEEELIELAKSVAIAEDEPAK